jgi:para-aminobenzoate synthetase component 1
MLSWADRFDIFCFLDNHEYGMPGHGMECLLGAGASERLEVAAGNALARLADFSAGRKDWLFGHLGYGLAKETEPPPAGTAAKDSRPDLSSHALPGIPSVINADPIGFPDLFFFVPFVVIELRPDNADPGRVPISGSMRIGSFEADQAAIFEQIGAMGAPSPTPSKMPAAIALQPRFSREEYLETVRRLQEHILRGDCYEINFCQEFFACPVSIDPLQTWFSLSRNSPNPFAACYKLDWRYLLCASPERYLRRTGNTLLSQPIKGTSPRIGEDGSGAAAAQDDKAGRDRLYSSAKDRSENVMVVDLVRNDLSKICLEGSVTVEELYGIYSFPQVHQMISSIKGELPPGVGLADCIKATFPMGSMTGAPKNRVVELIAQVERTRRGIFSGAVGYMDPGGDFDFNVVIRSILYNGKDGYLSYQVGSGITFYSDPEQEYEECLWKAEGIKKALGL